MAEKQLLRQEIASSVTAGLGAVLGLITTIVLVTSAWNHGNGNPRHVAIFAVFGAAVVAAYGASALMHALPQGHKRKIFETLDLVGIFLLIASTYTPFSLVSLPRPVGLWLFATVWLLSSAGIAGMLQNRKLFERFAVIFYLILGSLILTMIYPLASRLPLPGLVLFLAGGAAYYVGSVFFVWTRFVYHHTIWHLFALLGSMLHFFSVWLYVCPVADMRGW